MLIFDNLQKIWPNRTMCSGQLQKLEIIILKTEEISTLAIQISMITTSYLFLFLLVDLVINPKSALDITISE